MFAIVRHDQGRSLKWLARETAFSYSYVRMVAAGIEKGSRRFRAACAQLLGMDVSVLFHDGAGSQASQSVDADGSESDRAVNVVARAERYSTREEVAIGNTA